MINKYPHFKPPQDLGKKLDTMRSGTTAIVSRELKRDFIGFDINSEYVKIAEERIKEASRQVSL